MWRRVWLQDRLQAKQSNRFLLWMAYLGAVCGARGGDAVQQAQATLRVCVGKLSARWVPGQAAHREALLMLLPAAGTTRRRQATDSDPPRAPSAHTGGRTFPRMLYCSLPTRPSDHRRHLPPGSGRRETKPRRWRAAEAINRRDDDFQCAVFTFLALTKMATESTCTTCHAWILYIF